VDGQAVDDPKKDGSVVLDVIQQSENKKARKKDLKGQVLDKKWHEHRSSDSSGNVVIAVKLGQM
jgi:hypothetical protein